MRKHTPGPWAVNPINAQVDAFKDGEPIPVCRLLWPTTERSEAETEANGALIAAAPDLLAACERALPALECVSGRPGDTKFEIARDASLRIQYAIAKAKEMGLC